MEELHSGDPQRIGPYQLLARLGSGGMGRVFLGRSAGGRLVAVKVIRDDLASDPEFRVRFGREVAAARRVSGLFTALVVDADAIGPEPWLATAYVAGPSLADAVTGHGPLPAASVLALAAGLAEGLEAIHAAGVVHRDLKPANVLLAGDGPRVIDFGISRAAEASALTHTGLVVGSPGFMSPEQAEGHQVGPPSDVFSLGAVLTFAATGEGPFGAGSTAALVYRVVHGAPNLDHLPGQVRSLAERCLAKDPGRRPTTGQLLAELGGTGLAAGWLPAPIIQDFSRHVPPDLPLAVGPATVTAGRPRPPAGLAAGQPEPFGAGAQRPPRRRRRARLAWLITALAAGSAAAAVTLAGVFGAPAARPRHGLAPAALGSAAGGRSRQGSRGQSGAKSNVLQRSATSGLGSSSSATGAAKKSATRTGTSTTPSETGQPKTGQPKTGQPPPPGTVPAVPGGVTAAATSQYTILVAWTDASAGVNGFNIDNGCPVGSCAPGATLAQTTGPVTSATFSVTPGTYQCFRVRAFNHAGASGWAGYGCASTPSLIVPGTQEWTDTGVTVTSGDSLGITAAGTVYMDPAYPQGPAGNPACTPAADYASAAATFPAPDLPCWSLVGRIGNGPPFEVGTSTQITAASGRLYLGVNDGDFSDNSGSWTVNIKIGGLPPPP